jgi:hypothetical protein
MAGPAFGMVWRRNGAAGLVLLTAGMACSVQGLQAAARPGTAWDGAVLALVPLLQGVFVVVFFLFVYCQLGCHQAPVAWAKGGVPGMPYRASHLPCSGPAPAHPASVPADPSRERKLLAEHFESLEAEEEEGEEAEEEGDEGSEEEEGWRQRQRGSAHRDKRLRSGAEEAAAGGEAAGARRQPRMYAARDESAAAAFMQSKSFAGEKALPLGQRAAAAGGAANATARSGGSKELTFTPRRAPDGEEGGFGGGGGRGRGRGRGRNGGRDGSGRDGGGRGRSEGRGAGFGSGRGRSSAGGRGGGGGGRGRGRSSSSGGRGGGRGRGRGGGRGRG